MNKNIIKIILMLTSIAIYDICYSPSYSASETKAKEVKAKEVKKKNPLFYLKIINSQIVICCNSYDNLSIDYFSQPNKISVKISNWQKQKKIKLIYRQKNKNITKISQIITENLTLYLNIFLEKEKFYQLQVDETIKPFAGAKKLVLFLNKIAQKDFQKLSQKSQEKYIANIAEPLPNPYVKKITIVIDPGHGGKDSGAQSKLKKNKQNTTILEKNVVLEFSKILAAKLKKNKQFKVHLTRTNDKFLTLQQRFLLAKINKPDLLISIHADNYTDENIEGISIYLPSQEALNKSQELLTNNLNKTLIMSKNIKNERLMLSSLDKKEKLLTNNQLAKSIIENISQETTYLNNPIRSENFYIFKAYKFPTILIELGFLSNKNDLAKITNEQWQNSIAEKISTSIVDFFN